MLKEERDLPYKYQELGRVLSDEDREALKSFALGVLGSSDFVELYNRPDAWDPSGVIAKIQDDFRSYIKQHFYLTGVLEPRLFQIRRVRPGEVYSETYADLDPSEEILYSAIIPLETTSKNLWLGYEGFDVVSFAPQTGSIVVHRHESHNSWSTKEVPVEQIFVVLVQTELQKRADYNEFKIDPLEDDGVDY